MYRQKQLLELIDLEIQREQQTLEELREKFRRLPKGRLTSSSSRGYKYRFQCLGSGKGRRRIRLHEDRPEELQLMKDLETKHSIEEELPRIRANIRALEDFKENFAVIDNENVIFPCGSVDSSKWLTESYDTNPYKKENKKVMVSEDIFVRSKAEAAIYKSLEHAGAWFRYEPAFRVSSSKIVYPDFVILRKYDRKPILWEHCGMLHVESAARAYLLKLREYSSCGYTLGDNLIITVEDPEQPFSSGNAEAVIREMELDR